MLDESIVSALTNLDLFSAFGNGALTVDEFHCEFVQSYKDFLKSINGIKWENIRLEKGGDITAYLTIKNLDGDWNAYVNAAKAEIVPSVVGKILSAQFSEEALKIISDNVKYDIVDIAMSMIYQQHIRSEFHERLFVIYKSGHVPCGWHGKPNKGHLLYY